MEEIAYNKKRSRMMIKVVVTVSDTGKGIPKQIIDKIFEPFFLPPEK